MRVQERMLRMQSLPDAVTNCRHLRNLLGTAVLGSFQAGKFLGLSETARLRAGWRGNLHGRRQPRGLQQLREASHLAGSRRGGYRVEHGSPHLLQCEESQGVPAKAFPDGGIGGPGGGIPP